MAWWSVTLLLLKTLGVFGILLASSGAGQRLVAPDAAQDAGDFGVLVVGQEGGVDARVAHGLLLVQCLHDFQRVLGREAQLVVALHLQGGKVEEARRGFAAFLNFHIRHAQRGGAHGFQGFAGFFFGHEVAQGPQAALGVGRGVGIFGLVGRGHVAEQRAPVFGLQHPVRLRAEVLDFVPALHQQGQRGRLHPPDAQQLLVLVGGVFEGEEARGVQAQQPVAHGAALAGLVQASRTLWPRAGWQSPGGWPPP